MFIIGAAVAALLGAALARNLRLGEDERLRSAPPRLVFTGQSYLRPLYTEPPGYRAALRRSERLPRPRAAANVLADNRHDDQTEGGEPQEKGSLQMFAWQPQEDRQDLSGAEQGEGYGEGEEE
jgi:hypothetical protein